MALEREKNRLVFEKCQQILTELLKDEDNKYCVDCDAKSPRWASWNIGIFLCIRCAGIHRNLGVHISKVKSVNLDTWTPQQVACIQQMGNSRARAVYEANLQDNFRRPQTDTALEQFIRAKYEAKKYIAREWLPPQLPNPTWDIEMEKQLRKKKDKKCISGSIEFPAKARNVPNKASDESPMPLPKAPGSKNSSPGSTQNKKNLGNVGEKVDSEQSKQTGLIDLLGLDMPPPATNGNQNNENTDIFGDFLAAPVVSDSGKSVSDLSANSEGLVATKLEESSFFNQKQPELGSEKLSKDSILALYNQAPVHSQPPSSLLGCSSGLFMGGSGIPNVPHVIMPSQQVQPQNLIYFQQTSGVASVPSVAMQPQFITQSGPVYPLLPAGIQLSAANPFSQVQSHMSNLSLGGMTHPGFPQQMQKMPSTAQTMLNNLSMQSNNGLNSNPSQANNLWQ